MWYLLFQTDIAPCNKSTQKKSNLKCGNQLDLQILVLVLLQLVFYYHNLITFK